MKTSFLLAAAVTTLAAASAFFFGPKPAATSVAARAEAVPTRTAGPGTAATRASLPLPASPPQRPYQEAVSRFQLRFAGGLVVNEDTRRTLEMVASTDGMPVDEEGLRQFEGELAKGLPYDTVRSVMKLARGYLDYTREMEREVPVGDMPKTLAEYDAMAARIDGIRQRHFDAETQQALFGPYDRYARIVQEASFVETDRSLTGEQKLARLAALRAQLPPDQQAFVSAPAGGKS